MSEIERLRELLAKATPGPWVVCGVRGKKQNIGERAVFHDIGPDGTSVAAVWFDVGSGLGFMDAKLIVAAVNALPALLAEREADKAAIARLEGALRQLANDAEAQHCGHETTHRGGYLWTICDDCGARWADDDGGFVPYQPPPYVVRARAALHPQQEEANDDR